MLRNFVTAAEWHDVLLLSFVCPPLLSETTFRLSLPNSLLNRCFPPQRSSQCISVANYFSLPSFEDDDIAPAAAASAACFSAQYLCIGSSKIYLPDNTPSTTPTTILPPVTPVRRNCPPLLFVSIPVVYLVVRHLSVSERGVERMMWHCRICKFKTHHCMELT